MSSCAERSLCARTSWEHRNGLEGWVRTAAEAEFTSEMSIAEGGGVSVASATVYARKGDQEDLVSSYSASVFRREERGVRAAFGQSESSCDKKPGPRLTLVKQWSRNSSITI